MKIFIQNQVLKNKIHLKPELVVQELRLLASPTFFHFLHCRRPQPFRNQPRDSQVFALTGDDIDEDAESLASVHCYQQAEAGGQIHDTSATIMIPDVPQ